MLQFKKTLMPKTSVLWLAFAQIKREFRARNNNRGLAPNIGRFIFFLMLGGIFYGLGQGLYETIIIHKMPWRDLYYIAGQKLFISFCGLFFMSLMTAFMYFIDRSDLDLLLSSPIPPQKIIMSRLIAGSWRTILIFSIFSTAFIGYSALLISPLMFSYLPLAIGLAFLEAGLSFVIARFMLIKFGLINGRRMVQILGFGGLFGGVLAFQFLKEPQKLSLNINDLSPKPLHHHFGELFFSFLGKGLLGNWLIAFSIMIFGLLLFVALINIVGRNFGKDVAIITGQEDSQNNNIPNNILFNNNILAMYFNKEVKGIIRDPTSLVQIVAPMAGLIPMLFLIFSKNSIDKSLIGIICGPILVFLSASLSGSLAWLAVSVEEANELLLSSPANQRQIYMAKFFAAFVPALVEIILLTALIILHDLKGGILAFIFALFASLAIISVEFARPKPAKRPKMMQRPDRSIFAIIFGMIMVLIWSIALSVANYSVIFSLPIIAVALTMNIWAVYAAPKGASNGLKILFAK